MQDAGWDATEMNSGLTTFPSFFWGHIYFSISSWEQTPLTR